MTLRQTLRLVFIISAVIYGLVFGMALYRNFSSSEATPIPSRQITRNSLQLQEIWRKQDIHGGQTGLLSTETVVVVANYNRQALQYRLQGFEVSTGEMIWEVRLPRRVRVDSLIARDDRLYVAVTWEIQAYQLSDGQRLWQTQGEPYDRSGYRLGWIDENIVNYSSVVGENYRLMSVYGANSGALIHQEQIPINPMPLLTTARLEYKGEWGQLFAFDRNSGQQLWQLPLSGNPQHQPVLVGPKLLMATSGKQESIAALYAIDAINGALQWYTLEDDLVSNFAVIDQTVYAIRDDGSLVGLDLDTGQEVGTIEFNTAQTYPNQNTYQLSAGEHNLFVYYGDSRELIAFQR